MVRRFWFMLPVLLLAAGCLQNSQSDSPAPVSANNNSGSATAVANTAAPDAADATAQTPDGSTPDAANPDASGETPAAEPPADETPLQAAIRLAQTDDMPGAIAKLETAREADPQNRQLVLMHAQFTQFQAMQLFSGGDAEGAAKWFGVSEKSARKLRDEFGPIGAAESTVIATCFYNQACMLAKSKEIEPAVAMLNDAFTAGFDDLDQLDSDDAFAAIREEDAFKKFREAAPAAVAAAASKWLDAALDSFESFPFDFELPDLEGKPSKLADFRGKVLIVDIWGTWCPPCRMEIPHFIELHKKYKEQGLEIVGLNYEDGSPEEVVKTIKEFAEQNGVTYKLLIGDDPTQKQVPNFEGFPTTLFLDRSGKVRLVEVGYHPLAKLESVVKKLLAEPAGEETPAADAPAKTDAPAADPAPAAAPPEANP